MIDVKTMQTLNEVETIHVRSFIAEIRETSQFANVRNFAVSKGKTRRSFVDPPALAEGPGQSRRPRMQRCRPAQNPGLQATADTFVPHFGLVLPTLPLPASTIRMCPSSLPDAISGRLFGFHSTAESAAPNFMTRSTLAFATSMTRSEPSQVPVVSLSPAGFHATDAIGE